MISDVQLALDNGVQTYYADLTRDNIIRFVADDSIRGHFSNGPYASSSAWVQSGRQDSISIHDLRNSGVIRIPGDSIRNNRSFVIRPGRNIPIDSLRRISPSAISDITIFGNGLPDTVRDFTTFANEILISLASDTIDFELMQRYVGEELVRRNVAMPYNLIHYRHDSIIGSLVTNESYTLSTFSNSFYIPRHERLEMRFANASMIVLKRGMTDLIISLLIILAVVGSLWYLYRIINQQKQLAEIKNDLISNITHEFKTPIATISTAIDGIVNFNQDQDQKKTEKYLDISTNQLGKLNHMVEKLLETATLDSDRLLLTLEEVDVNKMLAGLSEKYQLIAQDKEIRFHTEFSVKVVQADLFHLENAISNLIDNAVKYGGNCIDIHLHDRKGKVGIRVVDDGTSLEKSQKERIFDKFYRVPTGNRHDVKGFGIGLYYSKKIIEKHGGSIFLNLGSNHTSFEVAI